MSLGQQLAPHLPFLRRYARSLVGSQAVGDALVRKTLEHIVGEPDEFPGDVDPRIGLYQVFERVRGATQDELQTPEEGDRSRLAEPI